jgi:hypothetical protein
MSVSTSSPMNLNLRGGAQRGTDIAAGRPRADSEFAAGPLARGDQLFYFTRDELQKLRLATEKAAA